MSQNMDAVFRVVTDRLLKLVSRTEEFVEPGDKLFTESAQIVKTLYDATKKLEPDCEEAKRSTLSQLIIDNFDEEQIWAGVDLQNKMLHAEFRSRLEHLKSQAQRSRLLPGPKLEQTQLSDVCEKDGLDSEDIEDDDDDDDDEAMAEEEEVDDGSGSEGEGDDDMKDILNDPDFQHMSDSEGDDLPLFEGHSSTDSDSGEDGDQPDETHEKKDSYLENALSSIKSHIRGGRKSQVDDQFFKLDEMEKFLEVEERAAPDDREHYDLFDEDQDDDAARADAKAMYSDFFVHEERAVTGKTEINKQVRFPDESPEAEELDKDADLGEVKSSFEVRSLKLKKEIQRLEKEAVSADKPWQLVGEVAGVDRPANSLLQEHLDYDHLAKEAPIITEKVSKCLEDIIIQRIKDKVWDDVERKIKPVENPYEFKKRLVLDQEKSKLSLAEVYEQEYLKQKDQLESSKRVVGMLDEDEMPPEQVEAIKKSMKLLFAKLDTLTHFHFTPRAVSAEIKIVRNAPTISMEEVAPVAMSDANLLAPQEVVDKGRGESKDNTESDRKRERRLKKLKQRTRQKELKKKTVLSTTPSTKPAPGNKRSKQKVLRDLEQAEKAGQLQLIKTSSAAKAVKSSSAFFSQLQSDVSSSSSSRKLPPKEKPKRSAQSLKL